MASVSIEGDKYKTLVIKHKGKRDRKGGYLGEVPEAVAEERKRALQAKIKRLGYPFPKAVTLEDWIARYKEAISNRKGAGTVKGEWITCRHFVRWLQANTDVTEPSEITEFHLYQYQTQRLKEASERTANLYRSYLINLFNWSLAQVPKLCEINPALSLVKAQEAEADTLAATPDQIAAVIEELPYGERLLLLLQFGSGCRPTEVCRLGESQINLPGKYFAVQNIRRNKKSKTGKQRYPPIQDYIYAQVEEALAIRGILRALSPRPLPDNLFCNRRGGPLQYRVWTERLSEACIAAGVDKFTGYAVRHGFATFLAAQGVPVQVIQKLLGHANLSTTMRYVHVEKPSREAVESIDFGKILGR